MDIRKKCLHHLLEEQVAKTPDVVAVIFENQQLTYRELDRRSNQFAHYLHSKGVKNEVPVGIFLERSIEMVIAVWGLLKSGGTYVPLDIDLSESRLSYIINDTQMSFLLTKRKFAGRLPGGVQCIYWNKEQPRIEQSSSGSLENDLNTENLAYLVYTSGSTGYPKGVMIPQRVFTRCLFWAQQVFHFTSADRFLLNFFRAPEELVLSPFYRCHTHSVTSKCGTGYRLTICNYSPLPN